MYKELDIGDIVMFSDYDAKIKYKDVEKKNPRSWVILAWTAEDYTLVALTTKSVNAYTGHKDKKLSNDLYIRTDNNIVTLNKNFVEHSPHKGAVTNRDMEIIIDLIQY